MRSEMVNEALVIAREFRNGSVNMVERLQEMNADFSL